MSKLTYHQYSGLCSFSRFRQVSASSVTATSLRCSRVAQAPSRLTWSPSSINRGWASYSKELSSTFRDGCHYRCKVMVTPANTRSFKVTAAVADTLSEPVQGPPTFSTLGLSQDLLNAVEALGLSKPTEIQQLGVTEVLKGGNVLLTSQTGSGKTLTYLLPLVEQLRRDEVEGEVQTRNKRPRALVVLPTRELTDQVLAVSKSLSHHARFRSTGITGGSPYGQQVRALERPQDLVVCTPGRLLQHLDKGNVLLSDLRYLVLDEADTMFDAGFGAEIRRLLRPLKTKPGHQVVMVAATVTKPVRRLLEEELPSMRDVVASSTHKASENCSHQFVRVPGNQSKLENLRQAVGRDVKRGKRTMIFCNTVDSCRAVEHYMGENGYPTVCYHGDMPKDVRAASFQHFLKGVAPSAASSDDAAASIPQDQQQQSSPLLVCTDLAARGLDIGQGGVDHVINFDFPKNPVDYMHRTGRTARAGAKGRVTSLVGKRDEVLAHELHKQIQSGANLDQALSSRKERTIKKERDLKQRRAVEYKQALRQARRTGGEVVKAKKGTKVMVVPKGSKNSSSKGKSGRSSARNIVGGRSSRRNTR